MGQVDCILDEINIGKRCVPHQAKCCCQNNFRKSHVIISLFSRAEILRIAVLFKKGMYKREKKQVKCGSYFAQDI